MIIGISEFGKLEVALSSPKKLLKNLKGGALTLVVLKKLKILMKKKKLRRTNLSFGEVWVALGNSRGLAAFDIMLLFRLSNK